MRSLMLMWLAMVLVCAGFVMGCGGDETTGDELTGTEGAETGLEGGNLPEGGIDDSGCVDSDLDGQFAVSGLCSQGTDCDDLDGDSYVGAAEICGDSIDQDCNGVDMLCCVDGDNDGAFGLTTICPEGTDCDDTDINMGPAVAEKCGPSGDGDGIDQNCNGQIDETCCSIECGGKQCGDNGCGGSCGTCAEGGTCSAVGICEYQTLPGSCSDGTCGEYVAGAECQCDASCFSVGDCCEDVCAVCSDGLEAQCGCVDADNDGYGEGPECLGSDCDPNNGDIHPGADEICGNGIDEDCVQGDEECPFVECDGSDADGDGYGTASGCEYIDCDDTNGDIHPGAVEICGDNIDQDCNNADLPCPAIDCVDGDGDGYGVGSECLGEDCNDQDPDVYPGADEVCGDGIDQDCENGDVSCPNACVDGDNDGYFAEVEGCDVGPYDCDDTDGASHPTAEEICGDGVDQDCSGADLDCPEPGTCVVDGDCNPGMWCDTTDGSCVWPKYWQWWAPVIHMDTDLGKIGYDFFTTVDYDGDNMAGNNKDNISSYDKPAVTHYTYVKTETHAYLGYYFYFPNRWSDASAFGTDYENTVRSVLLVIDLTTESSYGDLVLMETTTECSFFRYVPEGSELAGTVIDGLIEMDNSGDHARPIVYMRTQDHEIYGDRWYADFPATGFPGDTGGILRWDFESSTPNSALFDSTYSMVPVKDTMWPVRNNLSDLAYFETFGYFAGDDATDDSQAPWALRDCAFDTSYPAGEIVYDPATLVTRHFPVGWGTFATEYTYNPYAMRIDIESLEILETGGLFETNDVDPYINLYVRDGRASENKVLSESSGVQNNWKLDTIAAGTVLNMKDELGRYWFYGLQVDGFAYFAIEIRDADFGFDGWLMDPGETSTHSFSGTATLDWVMSIGTITVELP